MEDQLQKIKKKAEELLADISCNYAGSVEYASVNKMLAICNLKVQFEGSNQIQNVPFPLRGENAVTHPPPVVSAWQAGVCGTRSMKRSHTH